MAKERAHQLARKIRRTHRCAAVFGASTQGATTMKHTQEEINEICENVKAEKYSQASDQHQPVICSDDDAEQCITIPIRKELTESSIRVEIRMKNGRSFHM
jgi:hypothetical protein